MRHCLSTCNGLLLFDILQTADLYRNIFLFLYMADSRGSHKWVYFTFKSWVSSISFNFPIRCLLSNSFESNPFEDLQWCREEPSLIFEICKNMYRQQQTYIKDITASLCRRFLCLPQIDPFFIKRWLHPSLSSFQSVVFWPTLIVLWFNSYWW